MPEEPTTTILTTKYGEWNDWGKGSVHYTDELGTHWYKRIMSVGATNDNDYCLSRELIGKFSDDNFKRDFNESFFRYQETLVQSFRDANTVCGWHA